MSNEKKLRETLQAILNDSRKTADILEVALGVTAEDIGEEQVRKNTRNLHVFVHTYCSKNNEEFKIKDNSKNTLMPTSIRERLDELGMLE